MNNYSYEELMTGHKESFSVRITDDMMDSFRNLSGDFNPLHRDAETAARAGHPKPVVFGMLTASFLSTLAGVYLPGEKSLIQEVEIKFMKSVYPGDTLEITGEVAEKHDAVRVITLKVSIRRQNGEKVLRGRMRIGFS